MGNYVMIYSGGGMPEGEAEQAAVMAAWNGWYGSMGKAVVDGGNPFGMAKTVSADRSVSDGGVGTQATGYTIVSADSLDAAAEMAKGCPNLDAGGQVSVYEVFEIPAM